MSTSFGPSCDTADQQLTTTTPSKRSRKIGFLDLPGELRNRVYRLALVREEPFTLSKTQVTPLDHRRFQLKHGRPALLETNKTIAREASSIYYETNLFQLRGSALSVAAIRTFRAQAGRSIRKLQRISVRRSIQIGDLKQPVKVSFTASIDTSTKRIVLARPPYERKVYVSGKVKLKSSFVEPCRCEVDKLARNFSSGRTDGEDLMDFLEAYCQLLAMESRQTMIDICPLCDTIRRD